MKKIIKNKGIVIKVQDYLENAVIATILTENGKQSYLIKYWSLIMIMNSIIHIKFLAVS